MKLLIASDLHGSSYYVKKLIDSFNKEQADVLVLLGDILYHGPRNDLPLEYNPKKCIELLNSVKDKIICVKGNCDALVDEMVLNFPINDSASLFYNKMKLYFTHGHLYNPEHPLNVEHGAIIFYGHFHIQKMMDVNGVLYINPGSISIPKENNIHSYAIVEEHNVTIKDLEQNIIMKKDI